MQVGEQNNGRALSTLIGALTWRRMIGLAIFIGGGLVLLNGVIQQLIAQNAGMRAALIGGSTAALATALGTLPVLLSQKFSQRTYDAFLGFGGGVMLAATAFSLVIPAIAAVRLQGAAPLAASAIVGGGILIGALLILLLDRTEGNNLAPGIDDVQTQAHSLRRAWLFVMAVALHNLPEGLAIGVAYAGIDLDKANMLATGISIQDVPEGLVVALALRSVGYGRLVSVGLGILSGLIEPVAALVGVALIGISASLLPWGLAAAAGAMLFVICRDVIPEIHRNGNGTFASCSLVIGFILMTVLDTALA